MIWKPKVGQRVVIRYAAKRAHLFPFHGRRGVISIAASGRCAVNALVILDDGAIVIVPRGNLVECDAQKKGQDT